MSDIGGGAGIGGGGAGGTVTPSNENLAGHAPPLSRFCAEVRHITNKRTMCEAFNKIPVTKTLLGEVLKLLRLYLTLPATSATSERVFFCPPLTQELPKKHQEAGSFEQVPTHVLSQIDYGHTMDTFEIAKRLLVPKNYAKDIRVGVWLYLAWCTMSPPMFQNALPPLSDKSSGIIEFQR